MSTEVRLIALREKKRVLNEAATAIQRVVRARQAKHHVETLRQEHRVTLMADARRWLECWQDESSMWFYYNQEVRNNVP